MTSPELDKAEAVAWLGEGDGFKSFTRMKSVADLWCKGNVKVTAVCLSSELADAKAEAKQWHECFEQNAANAAHAIARSLDLETELAASRDREMALERDAEKYRNYAAEKSNQYVAERKAREAAEAEVKQLREALDRAAATAYRVCAETRHVTLGEKAAAAIRALATTGLQGGDNAQD